MIFERYLRIPLPANGTFEDIKLGITKSQGGIRHLRERVYFNYRDSTTLVLYYNSLGKDARAEDDHAIRNIRETMPT